MASVTFTCRAVPDGPVRAVAGGDEGLVWFADGRAVVEDPVLVAALLEAPDAFGIYADEAELAAFADALDAEDGQDDEAADEHGTVPVLVGEPGPELPVPPASASKARWVAYWTAHPDEALRLSEDAAQGMTRDALAMRHAEHDGG